MTREERERMPAKYLVHVTKCICEIADLPVAKLIEMARLSCLIPGWPITRRGTQPSIPDAGDTGQEEQDQGIEQ